MLDTDNPLALPHFEDRLLERLHERQSAGTGWSDAGDEPAVGKGREHRGNRRGRLVAAAAAVTILVGGAAAAIGTRDGGGRADVDTNATGDRDPQVDDVLRAVEDAIASGTIVHNVLWDGEDEAWIDLRTGAERTIGPSGYEDRTMDWGRSEPPTLEGEQPSGGGPVPRRLVDNCLHQYADVTDPELQMFDVLTPLRVDLAEGEWVVDGPVDVDGRTLVKMTYVVVSPGDMHIDPPETDGEPNTAAEQESAAAALEAIQEAVETDLRAQQQTLYVDPDTDLPALVVQGEHQDLGQAQELDYLPRTAENLQVLVPPVPDGYEQVDELVRGDVREQMGCVD
jgi:hypothetical protein